MNVNNTPNSAHTKSIAFSCYHSSNKDGEHFVPEHTLSFQLSGILILNDGHKKYFPENGCFRLIRRNQLLKFVKEPPADGPFKSVSIYLDQETLKNFSLENGIVAAKKQYDVPVISIKKTAVIESYMESMLTYNQSNAFTNQALIDVKLKEGILLILQTNPEMKNILFDFSEPFKIDLEAFMNKNYHFNVRLERFAYLTGRSLATFKRDFERIFGSSPGRWLQLKRLQQAYYLITEKRRKASDIYIELGFEDLSHFSYAFKNQFGVAPSKING